MRYALAAVIVCLCPLPAFARQATPPSPPPSIGLPLPPIGLPLPAIGPAAPAERRQPTSPGPPAAPPPAHPAPAIVIFGAPYGFGVDPALQFARPGVIAPAATAPVEAPADGPPMGRLRLEVEPEDLAQVFVDGDYVGTPSDLDREIDLAPGRRQIEIRARGYETQTFDARVIAGRTITYREKLIRTPKSDAQSAALTAPTSPTSPTRPRTTFYLIPGCYLGNVHPDLVKLPEGCDFSRMITHTPH